MKPNTITDQLSPNVINALLLLVLCLAFGMSISTGSSNLSVFSLISSAFSTEDSLEKLIFIDIRLPRALIGIVVGATLGMCGAALQGLLRNPLVDSGLVGISNGAALGAVIALYFGFGNLIWFAVPAAGMIGAMVSTLLIFILSGKSSSIMTLLLAGVAVNSLTVSLISLALNFAPNPYAMSEIIYWLLGSISNRSLNDFYLVIPFMLTGWFMILLSAKYLTALSLGEDTAQTLGFNSKRSRAFLIIGIALSVGAAVSVSGGIGFVGLFIPHMMRPLMRFEPGKLLLSSALAGAIMVLLADVAVQVISPTQELKLGVITALIGGPFFLYLIVKNRYVFK